MYETPAHQFSSFSSFDLHADETKPVKVETLTGHSLHSLHHKARSYQVGLFILEAAISTEMVNVTLGLAAILLISLFNLRIMSRTLKR